MYPSHPSLALAALFPLDDRWLRRPLLRLLGLRAHHDDTEVRRRKLSQVQTYLMWHVCVCALKFSVQVRGVKGHGAPGLQHGMF